MKTQKKPQRWDDPDKHPDLIEVLLESGQPLELNEGTLAALLTRCCDAGAIPDGPLVWRAGLLEGQIALLVARIDLLEAQVKGRRRNRG